MSKLSFVALSLQTTHLDPASVSKAAYVKLVDGNITRQDELPIIPPTSMPLVTEQTDELGTPWNEALAQLGMMIGKLPIVSYYRDADKEIFHAASRQFNVEPPPFHWLDCRELARKLLPDLPDVQLSTVLKILDLYEDFADSSAVEQTTQIVIALAHRHGANTVAQLWDELYDHPDAPLGLDSTFHGVAAPGGTAEDDEVIDGPLAAEVLPFAATAGIATQSQQTPDIAVVTPEESAQEGEAAGEMPQEEPLTPPQLLINEQDEDDSASQAEPVATPLESSDPAPQEMPPTPPITADEEVPVFLQEPSGKSQDGEVSKLLDIEEPGEDHAEPPGVTEASLEDTSDTDENALGAVDETTHSTDDLIESPTPAEAAPSEDIEASQLSDSGSDEPTPSIPVEESPAIGDTTPDEIAVEDEIEPHDPSEPAFLKEPVSVENEPKPDEPELVKEPIWDESEPPISEPVAVTQTEPPAQAPIFSQIESSAEHSPEFANLRAEESPLTAAPVNRRAQAVSDWDSAIQRDVQAIKIAERPQVRQAVTRASKTHRIFGLIGLVVFGALSAIGMVLTVMAVMLFFTENSLMLETKIAGVILTVAITLLSLLMTNVSYRSFRTKWRS